MSERTVCPECHNQFEGRMPGHIYGSNWDFVPCRTCAGSGFEPTEQIEVTVGKNERGAWCVYLDGQFVSDHRSHEAARTAARRHQGLDTAPTTVWR